MITNLPAIIFLCGFMGAGKTTLGKKLARVMELPYRDLDELIEEKAGKKITDIFGDSGEAAFRRLERQTLRETIDGYRGILSLGGGTLQNRQIMELIKRNGLLIFVEAPFPVILNRLENADDRPLLLNERGERRDRRDLREDLQALYRKRLPYYQQAEITIRNPDDRPLRTIIEDLIKKIRYHVSQY